MLIATWNVNSLKVRLNLVLELLKKHKIDILLLQEVKGVADIFPKEAISLAGYNYSYSLQKAYNGVASLSLGKQTIIHTALPNFKDEAARYIEIEVNGIRVINIYVPNGNPINTEKYTYKLEWQEALYQHVESLISSKVDFVIGGDFNIVPYNYDVYNPQSFANDAIFQDEVRKLYFKFLNLGLTDALDICLPKMKERYTWWSYKRGSIHKNWGARIDHILISPVISNRIKSVFVDTAPRNMEQTSDHAPLMVELK